MGREDVEMGLVGWWSGKKRMVVELVAKRLLALTILHLTC